MVTMRQMKEFLGEMPPKPEPETGDAVLLAVIREQAKQLAAAKDSRRQAPSEAVRSFDDSRSDRPPGVSFVL